MRKLFALLGVLMAACHGASWPEEPAPRTHWLVIAPHPDDEALIASGLIARATAAGESVAVIVMTNGDFDCIHDGLVREGESVTGMRAVGIPENRIYFLGYPDGGLARLGEEPLASKRLEGGRCVSGTTTYGARGHGRADVHTARLGRPAWYTRSEAISDLATLLRELRPEDVVVTHPSDTHPDHAATYALLRSALDRLPEAPRVHRAIIHNGDCWPTGPEAHEPCPVAHLSVDEVTPPLTRRLRGYRPRERFAVPASCRAKDRASNPKLRAIDAYASQTRRISESYLFSFARSDEVFFPEEYVRQDRSWRRRASATPRQTFVAVLGRDVSVIDAGAYRLEVDRSRLEASVRKARASEVIQTWPLPHDLFRGQREVAVAVDVDARADDSAVEIALRMRGEWIGMAVDVR